MKFLSYTKWTIGFLVVFSTQLSQAQFINYFENNKFSWPDSYLVPNEEAIEKAFPIFEQSQKGVYIGVGTERSFVGAAVSNATHLLLTDMDQDALTYNRMLIELFKYAKTKEEFYEIRTNFNQLTELFSHYQSSALSDQSIYELLKKYRGLELFNGTNWFYNDDSIRRPNSSFWQNDELYEKLRQMALKDRIQVIDIDFTKQSQRQNLIQAIQEKKIKLSILDLSNAWQQGYMAKKTHSVLKDFLQISNSKTIYLATWIEGVIFNPYHGFYLKRLMSDHSFSSEKLLGDSDIDFNNCRYVLKGHD